jgi:GT2 family glycosyltransferase
MAREKHFEKVKGFDPSTFLYLEEAILSERMKAEGYRTYYSRTLPLTHRSGYSIRKSSLNINERIFASALYYYRHYMKVNPILVSLSRFSFFMYEKIYKKGFLFLENIMGIN